MNHVRHTLAQANLAVHRGYPLRLCFIEVYGATEAVLLRSVGMHVWSDYAGYFATVPPPPPERRPFLLGVRREEALAAPGSFAFALFATPQPCLHLTASDQAVLCLALEAHTDEAIARALGTAVVTVKKHWEAINRKVARSGVAILSEEPEGKGAAQRSREKRRLVVEYVRNHPEEIRALPHQPRRRGPWRKRFHPKRRPPRG